MIGSTVLRLRTRPGLDSNMPGRTPSDEARPNGTAVAEAGAGARAAPGRITSAVLMAAWTVPLLLGPGSGGLRVAILLAVPVMLLATIAWSPIRRAIGRRRRAGPGQPPSGHEGAEDPAALLLLAAGPAGLLDRPFVPRVAGSTVDLRAGESIALVGRPEPVRAAARWLLCQLAAGRCEPAPHPGPAWTWLADLPGGASGSPHVHLRDGLEQPGASTGWQGAGAAPEDVVILLAHALSAVPLWCRRVVEVPDSDAHLVSREWAETVADALAGSVTASSVRDPLPRDVLLTDLLADPVSAWADPDQGLGAAFAVDAQGPVVVDLARQGPHALVAGTTGSGKSELLTGWVLALACRYPPSALTVVAFDYKGGATFGPLSGLPHLAGLHTDLDAASTARALTGLRAELRRRERVLADAGVRDLAGLLRADPSRMSRLLVVVDEFRALADEHPDLMAAFVRLAAQGRSLGMHLVLATQRPAGAVSADLRANIQVTVCLRVTAGHESSDVLGSPAAASLPRIPGRALLGIDGLREIQTAWCGPATEETIRSIVARTAQVATHRREASTPALWAPPLPTRAPAPAVDAGAPPGRLPVVLVERTDRQRQVPWWWPLDATPLVVAGSPGTGRTTTLATLAVGAAAAGIAVHWVGRRPPLPPGHPLLGTVVDPSDPRRLVRLVTLLGQRPSPGLLCVDDADAVVGPAHPVAPETLERLLLGRAAGLTVALSGSLGLLTARWAAGARYRLVLGPLDHGQAALAGVPRTLVGGEPPPPGRGVLLGDGPPCAVQVLVPADPPAGRHTPEPATVLRLEPVPAHVPAARLPPPPGADQVALGRGGDGAEVIWWSAARGARLVIAGPSESGRSSALDLIERGLIAHGHRPLRLDPSSPAPAGRVPGGSPGPDAWLVDDAESLQPVVADAVGARWSAPDGVVVATVRSEGMAAAYRGIPGLLRGARSSLVLAPLRGGPAHLSAAEVMPHADPTAPGTPGRGVLIEPRRTVPVQVACWGDPPIR